MLIGRGRSRRLSLVPDLGCTANASVAFDYLVDKGLSDFQAAAVIGNLQQESALNPRAVFAAEKSYGIAQWRLDRWQNLLSFAASTSQDPWSFDVQLEFLWRELQTVPSLGLAQLLASTTIEDATVVFQDKFERCGDCRTEKRISAAKSVLFTCPSVSAPILTSSRSGVVAGTVGVVALATAVGYGLYKLLSYRTREDPEPEFAPTAPPPVFKPIYRP